MSGMAITSLSPAAFGAKTITRQTAAATASGALASTQQLTPEQQAEVQQLQQTDREVRQHEQAHLAAAGGYARGGASFTYTTGPDGKRYATGGEVSIDTSRERTPEATIQKMETVKNAAVAPQNPSAQDRAVYAQAQQTEAEARRTLEEEKNAQGTGNVAGATLTPTAGTTSTTGTPAQHTPLAKAVITDSLIGKNVDMTV